jgi:hypothetical protein
VNYIGYRYLYKYQYTSKICAGFCYVIRKKDRGGPPGLINLGAASHLGFDSQDFADNVAALNLEPITRHPSQPQQRLLLIILMLMVTLASKHRTYYNPTERSGGHW